MLPSPFFGQDHGTTTTTTSSETMKMEHDNLFWEQQQQQQQHRLGPNVYPSIPGSDFHHFSSRNDSSSSSSSSHLQALRDSMSLPQGNNNMPLFSQQLMPAPPLLLQLGDEAQFRTSTLPDLRSDLFGFERTPHRTQFQRESHILAERQRREEMNEKFSALRAMLPKSSKKDKASIVGDTINYVMELEKTLKQLQACRAKKKGYFLPKEGKLPVEADQSQEPKNRPVQVEVQALGQQAVIKLVCTKSPKLVLRILTALEQCKVEVLQSNVTTLGDNAVHFFTIELLPGLSVSNEELVAALEGAAATKNSSQQRAS